VLHWHLSDDQGFRLEVRALPELHRRGGDNEYYSHEQVEAVVREAALRGIRVVPEIDMPAHVGAILLAYPALAWGPAPSSFDTQWGVRPWVLDPSKPKLYTWIGQLLDEIVTLFPDEYVVFAFSPFPDLFRYYHIGGDEVPHAAWQGAGPGSWSTWMIANKLRSQHDVQLHFNQKLVGLLAARGRKMVGWDEITVDWLPKSVTVQLWRGWMPDVAQRVASLGLSSIVSSELYLDWARSIKHYYKVSTCCSVCFSC
jgi:hexosaminidase